MEFIDWMERKTGQRPAEPQIFQTPHKLRLILCLLLALATLALYNPVTRAPFLNYDDTIYVTDNPHVHAGLTWSTVVWAFRSTEATNWHPVTWLSHALDWQMFGSGPAGPHIVNVLLHAANAILLFLILENATRGTWRSLAVAGLFALHPINVESVAWISERKNVLSMLFFLLALAAYGWYARRPAIGRYLAVTAAFALGLMAKPQVITFPFALLLLDYWPLRRLLPDRVEGQPLDAPVRGPTFWSLVWEKMPWFALSAASAIITLKVQTDARHRSLSVWIHLGNAAIAYVKYVGKAFWPVNLAVVYPHPEHAISIPAAAFSATAIVAVTILALIFRQRRPFFVGWFWFLGTMVPMAGLVQVGVHSMADRYAYIPLLGIFLIVCWAAADMRGLLRVPTRVLAAGATVILLMLGFALHRQVSFWGDNLTLWSHTLEITGANYTAEDNVATALIELGRQEEALPHLQRAHLLRPEDPLSALNLATYQRLHGNYQGALDGYAKVLQVTTISYFVEGAQLNSGYAHYALKQWDRARQDFEAVVKTEPENAVAYRALGLLAQRAGDISRAAEDYERSVKAEPTPVGYLLLAQALELDGQRDAARAAEAQATRMDPDLTRDLQIVKKLLTD